MRRPPLSSIAPIVRSRSLAPSIAVAALTFVAACGSDKSSGNTTTTGPTSSSGTTIAIDSASNFQTAAVATPITVSVHLKDANGGPVANTIVHWTVITGAGSVAPDSGATDGTGAATASWTLGNLAGGQSLAASITGAVATLSATAVGGAPTKFAKVSADSQSVVSGAVVQFIVKATDQFGNGVPGVTVTWSSDAGTPSPASTTTGDSGNTAVTFTTTSTPHTYTITASAAGLTPVTFTLTGV